MLVPCHPRSRKRLEATGFKLDSRVIQHEPLGFHDYNCLQMYAFCVVSDSGTLPEESSFFTSLGHPIPAVCIRTSMLSARYLGPSNFGLINYAVSVVAFAVPIMQLGLPNILVQEMVEANDSEGTMSMYRSGYGPSRSNGYRYF